MGGYKFMLPEREIYPRCFDLLIPQDDLQFSIEADTRKAFILTNPRTVTPQGAMVLARYGKLPVMKVEDINDKSKADALTKTLVCLQAIWMLIQCIARKAQQLPVTLLEINTVMHVVCALCMYLLWMRKPQNVSQPTVLDPEDPVIGILLQAEYVETGVTSLEDSFPAVTVSEGGILSFQEDSLKSFSVPEETSIQRAFKKNNKITFRAQNENGYTTQVSFSRSGRYTTERGQYIRYLRAPSFKHFRQTCKVLLDSLPRELPATSPENESLAAAGRIFYYSDDFFQTYSSNWKTEGRISNEMDINGGTIPILIVLTAIYGGIYLWPWNGHFPTHFERYLWRASGCLIALSGCFLGLFLNLPEFPFKAINLSTYYLFAAILTILIATYPFARAYLVAEAFASLRSLPMGACNEYAGKKY